MVKHHVLPRFIHNAVAAFPFRQDRAGPGSRQLLPGIGFHGIGGIGLQVHLPLRRRSEAIPHRLRRGQDAQPHGGQIHRDQQPQQHHQPQGVLHPPGDGSAEKESQQQNHGDQHGGSDQDIFHFPSPAFLRISESSRISSSVSAWSSTRALIMRPSLPPYTRSRKPAVSSRLASSRSITG